MIVYRVEGQVCIKHHMYGDAKQFPRKIKLDCGCVLVRHEEKVR